MSFGLQGSYSTPMREDAVGHVPIQMPYADHFIYRLGLPYFGMVTGVLIGLACVAIDVPRYAKKLTANNNIPVPEWRLPITMAGGISFTIGLFWFGWTSRSDIPWIVPTLAGLCLGFGIYTVFLQW